LLKTPVDIDLAASAVDCAWAFGALQFTLETGVFATVTTLIAKTRPVPLPRTQIALNTVAFTYMVPLGISSARRCGLVSAWQARPRGAGAAARDGDHHWCWS